MKNSFLLTGNVGSGPQLWEEGGTPRALFSIAENIRKKDEETGAYVTIHTNWFRVVAFGALAKRVTGQLSVGDRVSIRGSIRSYDFENSEGKKEYGVEVIASSIEKSAILASEKITRKPIQKSAFLTGSKS